MLRAGFSIRKGEQELCDGSLSRPPSEKCLTPDYLTQLQTLCHGQQTCNWPVPLHYAVCGRGIKAQANNINICFVKWQFLLFSFLLNIPVSVVSLGINF